MRPGSGKFMYCATPTRMRHLGAQVKSRARAMGPIVPVFPFDFGNVEDFENNPLVGYDKVLEFDLRVMLVHDLVGIFGISNGVMGEFRKALDHQMEIRVDLELDPEWEKYNDQLKDKYGDPLKQLRGPHRLFALIGPSAIGKTYWSARLMERYAGRLARAKNTTTRAQRDERDHESYNFISRDAFETGIEDSQFLEHDQYLGHYYGSSMAEIRRVLKTSSGIFAITPTGAAALHARRYEINVTNILLKPANLGVLLKNFERRGINDWGKRFELRDAAERFTLPNDVAHKEVTITGDDQHDEEQLVRIIEPLISPV